MKKIKEEYRLFKLADGYMYFNQLTDIRPSMLRFILFTLLLKLYGIIEVDE